jgi:hypothetical protein
MPAGGDLARIPNTSHSLTPLGAARQRRLQPGTSHSNPGACSDPMWKPCMSHTGISPSLLNLRVRVLDLRIFGTFLEY